MKTITYTHKGWFGLCPVYIERINNEGCSIKARYPYTDWLIDLSVGIYGLLFKLSMTTEPMWLIKTTGVLRVPIIAEVEV